MWSRRNAFPLAALPEAGCAPLASTPSDDLRSSTGLAEESKIKFITTLAYTLIPEVTREEAEVIFSWALRNAGGGGRDKHRLAALNQIEYFFAGTDNGLLCMFPIFPPTMRPFLTTSTGGETVLVPWNAGPRRILHRHRHEESVMSIAKLATLVASAGSDGYMHLSSFHPAPRHIISIPHPTAVHCLLMWEGTLFLERETNPQQRSAVAIAESSIVYIFTGDESGLVRLWRVNVEDHTYFLSTVFVITAHAGGTGFSSPLHYLACEDGDRTSVPTKQSKVIHSLALDEDRRLLAGVEGGVVVWGLAALPWKQREEDHILCWDIEQGKMNTTALSTLQFRTRRLTNVSVWVKGADLLQKSICSEKRGDDEVNGSNSQMKVIQKSRWKPKYGTHVANGFDVGVVSNLLTLPPLQDSNGESAMSLLQTTYVPLQFPSLKNTVYFPLHAVEPAFTPLHILPTIGSTCFALLVLQHGRRIVTGGSDGKVVVWLWDTSAEVYMQGLVSSEGQGHCGLIRHLCLLRSPDIFISCGYDDGLIKEWHVYDEPEFFMRCERSLKVIPANLYGLTSHVPLPVLEESVGGISCAVSFPEFHALFIVGLFESSIQTFSLMEVHGCALPEDYVYNGYKTVRLTASVAACVSRGLGLGDVDGRLEGGNHASV
ncbi:uncharacterized protein Tco025E_04430 [Trypanosoma conorhini]|uniref:Uncharacterized protein n=1 Tax=Trypanosoma conorhini TaxID=83891 RepID=A0A3R7PE08_9TRYP|nr:uncharacterized protein Tco025E_04430 [Trypanosoma conorhini]RNF18556.1 hypothetical protein Tco025E_04430 [Trypanosoma conorhini]